MQKQVTRQTETVLPYANLYSDMLVSVLEGSSIADCAQAAGAKLGYDIAGEVRRSSTRGDPMVACYIESSFPAMLMFAYKYGDDGYEKLLMASANAGGENVARGSLLGALAGAKYGLSGMPVGLREGLLHSQELVDESTQFANAYGFTE